MESLNGSNLNESVWNDQDDTVSQERHEHEETSVVDSSKKNQFLFDLNKTYCEEKELLVTENPRRVNRPGLNECPNELITLSDDSNTGHDELIYCCQQSDLRAKLGPVSIRSKFCLDTEKEEGNTRQVVHLPPVYSEDRKGKSPMICCPPSLPHQELVSEVPNTLNDFSHYSNGIPPASSDMTQSLEQDPYSAMQVAKSNASSLKAQGEPACRKSNNARARGSQRRGVPYTRQQPEIAPSIPGPKVALKLRPLCPKPKLALPICDSAYSQVPFPVTLYPSAANPARNVEFLRNLVRKHGKDGHRVPLMPLARTSQAAGGSRNGYRWIEPKPVQDIKPEAAEVSHLGHSLIQLRRYEAVKYFSRTRKGKGKGKLVVRSEG